MPWELDPVPRDLEPFPREFDPLPLEPDSLSREPDPVPRDLSRYLGITSRFLGSSTRCRSTTKRYLWTSIRGRGRRARKKGAWWARPLTVLWRHGYEWLAGSDATFGAAEGAGVADCTSIAGGGGGVGVFALWEWPRNGSRSNSESFGDAGP